MKYLVSIVFLFFLVGVNAQVDTLQLKDTIHSPKKATLYSAILPGAGQVYNKKWWKVPIIYAGLGVSAYLFDQNNREYNKIKEELIQSQSTDLSDLDRVQQKRDFAALGFIGVYVLQIVDANVDAHLFHFDVSDDISLDWQPQFQHAFTTRRETTLGLTVSISF